MKYRSSPREGKDARDTRHIKPDELCVSSMPRCPMPERTNGVFLKRAAAVATPLDSGAHTQKEDKSASGKVAESE